MKLAFIPLDKLIIAKANMRHGKSPDLADLIPTIRARGVLQSLVVRPLGEADLFEIIAGSRRYRASLIVEEERRASGGADAEPMLLPCAILDTGDDAGAVEASLIENHARLDPDEVTQWEGFVRLIREGRSPADIAATFGMPDLAVRRILALGNLLPRIRTLYRRGDIDAATVRHLTMASKIRQRDWLGLLDDPDARAPAGQQLKAWLFGGQSIPARHALFDLASYAGSIVADLFGEQGYFADSDSFWEAQKAAIAARRNAYLDEGWREVVILDPAHIFHSWEYAKAPKRKGGRVYVDVRASGEVSFHEGYVTEKEARAVAKGEAMGQGSKAVRPELTSTLTAYVNLHRHAAARAALLSAPGLALRLMVAHMVVGSPLWSVRPEPQAVRNDAVAESLELSRGESLFDAQRRAILASLGLSSEERRIVGSDIDMASLLPRLIVLPDEAVMGVIALLMGETLAAGSVAVELIGLHLAVDMADWWTADAAFFDLIRDRQLLLALLAEVASPMVADANKTEKSKLLKQIIRDHLEGTDGRKKCESWVPRWMRFPPAAYTDRGGVAMVDVHAQSLLPDGEEEESDRPVPFSEESDLPVPFTDPVQIAA